MRASARADLVDPLLYGIVVLIEVLVVELGATGSHEVFDGVLDRRGWLYFFRVSAAVRASSVFDAAARSRSAPVTSTQAPPSRGAFTVSTADAVAAEEDSVDCRASVDVFDALAGVGMVGVGLEHPTSVNAAAPAVATSRRFTSRLPAWRVLM